MLMRRLSIVAGGAATALLLSTGSAFAHGCYFTNPNPNADDGRAGSSGFVSFTDLALMFTEGAACDEAIEYLAPLAGVTPDTLINAHGMMAGGSGGNKAIQHMDFAALETNFDAAMSLCGSSGE